ncbi:MAG: DUF3883 domain-containing protein [Candidatus Micrarchaeota archaeon]|nr:DUF3883 domain-containing protein [Candidatus Micrarchaeota archaeon]
MSNDSLSAETHIQEIAKDYNDSKKENKRLRDALNGSLKRITQIWSDRTHALVEILQNADDAQATEVSYQFLPTGILFLHNGRAFKKNDIDAICSVDQSTKDSEKHTGFMGIGFKAVFGISHSPYVISAPWRFSFSNKSSSPDDWIWCLTPQWINEMPQEIGTVAVDRTIIWLPYLQELTDDERNEIGTRFFDRLDGISLMFLRNIQKIYLEKNQQKRCLSRDKNQITEEYDGKKMLKAYHIVKQSFSVPDHVKKDAVIKESRLKAKIREITLVFALDQEGNLTRTDEKPPLYSFLPTDSYPGFDFAINADFILDTSRREVRDLQWNNWLWQCVSKTLKDAIDGREGKDGFKHHVPHRYQFYKILPSKKHSKDVNESIKNNFFDDFFKYCCDSEIIITSDETWAKPNDTVIANSSIQELFDREKLASLCTRKYFLNQKVIVAKELLTDFGALDFNHAYLFKALADLDWIKSKNHDWFLTLYSYLKNSYDEQHTKKFNIGLGAGELSYVDTLMGLPIVKTSDGSLKKISEVLFPPKNMDEHDKYLMSIVPEIYLIDVTFSDLVALLKFLNIKEYNSTSLVKKIVDAFDNNKWKEWSEKDTVGLVNFISNYLKENEWRIPSDLTRLSTVILMTEDGRLERADKCYMPNNDLKALYPKACFVKSGVYENEFLKALEVENIPKLNAVDRLIPDDNGKFSQFNEYLSWLSSIGHYVSRENIQRVSEIDAWNQIAWTPQTSKIMFRYLLKNWAFYSQHLSSLKQYFHYVSRYTPIHSYLYWELTQTSWIPTSKGMMLPSTNIFVKTDKIKKIAGDSVPYLLLPDGITNDELENSEFVKFLGISKNLELQSLVNILAYVSDQPEKINLEQISRIYKAIGKEIDENDEIKLEIGHLLLDDKKTFKAPSMLFWNDDERIWKQLKDSVTGNTGDVCFVWAPDIEQRYLAKFFRKIGVKFLSEQIKRELISSDTKIVSQPEKIEVAIRKKAKFAYSLFAHVKNENAEKIHLQLTKIKIYECRNIAINLVLNANTYKTSADTFYDELENKLYFVGDIDFFEVAAELARTYQLDFNYLTILEDILEKNDDKLINRLRHLKIQILSPLKTNESDNLDEEEDQKSADEDLEKKDDQPASEGTSSTESDDSKQKTAAASDTPSSSDEQKDTKTLNEKDQESRENAPQPETEAQTRKEGHDDSESSSDSTSKRYTRNNTDDKTDAPAHPAGGEDKLKKENDSQDYDEDEWSGASTGERLSYQERMQIEEANTVRVIEYEKRHNRVAVDKRKENIGWDLESTDNKTGDVRFIELKGPSRVELTDNERGAAKTKGISYYLYVVDENRVYICQDPTKNIKKIEVLQTRWKVLDWKHKSDEL